MQQPASLQTENLILETAIANRTDNTARILAAGQLTLDSEHSARVDWSRDRHALGHMTLKSHVTIISRAQTLLRVIVSRLFPAELIN